MRIIAKIVKEYFLPDSDEEKIHLAWNAHHLCDANKSG